jgi:hypothetical protein
MNEVHMNRTLKSLSFFFLMIGVIQVSSVLSPAHADMIEGIVAVVDNSVIMYSDLVKKMDALGAKSHDQATARQVLQLMVEDMLIKKVYRAMSLPEVDLKQAEEVSKSMKIDVESAKTFIMKSTLMEIMVKSRVVVTEAMIHTYYENNKQYAGKDSIHLKQILINKDSAKAEQALQEIRKGESFDDAAKKYSDVLASGSADIGWVSLNDLAEEAHKVLEPAKPGDIVGPVTLGNKILIYQAVERGVAGGRPFEEVRDEIVDTLQVKYRNEAFEHWLKMVMAEHYIGIFI